LFYCINQPVDKPQLSYMVNKVTVSLKKCGLTAGEWSCSIRSYPHQVPRHHDLSQPTMLKRATYFPIWNP